MFKAIVEYNDGWTITEYIYADDFASIEEAQNSGEVDIFNEGNPYGDSRSVNMVIDSATADEIDKWISGYHKKYFVCEHFDWWVRFKTINVTLRLEAIKGGEVTFVHKTFFPKEVTK